MLDIVMVPNTILSGSARRPLSIILFSYIHSKTSHSVPTPNVENLPVYSTIVFSLQAVPKIFITLHNFKLVFFFDTRAIVTKLNNFIGLEIWVRDHINLFL